MERTHSLPLPAAEIAAPACASRAAKVGHRFGLDADAIYAFEEAAG